MMMKQLVCRDVFRELPEYPSMDILIDVRLIMMLLRVPEEPHPLLYFVE